MLTYYALRWASCVLPLVPLRLGYFLARLGGDIAYLFNTRGRGAVRSNLVRVLGSNISERRLGSVTRQVFRNAAKNYFDLLRVPRSDLRQVENRLIIHNGHYLEEAIGKGRGVILATAHFGNFDFVGQVLAERNLRVTAIAEPLHPPRLFDFITGLRSSRGISFIPTGTANLRKVVRALHRGEIVGIAYDRDLQGKGLEMRFFGQDTTIPLGVVSLGLRTGAVIVPAFVVRQPDDSFVAYVEPPLGINGQADMDREDREQSGLEKLVRILECYIGRYPEQWIVFQPIWDDPRRSA